MVLAGRTRRSVALLHFLCLLWATFAMSQNLGLPKSVRKEHDETYGGQWKYLTFLNQLLQTLLYLLCVIIDAVALFVPSQEKRVSSLVLPIRDFIFSAYVFPVGLWNVGKKLCETTLDFVSKLTTSKTITEWDQNWWEKLAKERLNLKKGWSWLGAVEKYFSEKNFPNATL